MRRSLLLSMLSLFCAQPVLAQFIRFGPAATVSITIQHAPASGLLFKRVAFGQPQGECASELVDRMLLPDFQGSHIDVIERQQLDQILAEHNFSRTAYADPATASQIGKILGPSALILVSVYSCTPQQQSLYDDRQDYKGAVTRVFISKTRFTLEGSIKVVDLTTGQVKGSTNFQSKPEKQNEATNGQPESPPTDEVKDRAMQEAKLQIHNMFFPGVEVRSLPFYDDKDCGLKNAYEVLRRGDRQGGLKMAQDAVQQCESGHKKDKTLARSYYDAGVAYCLQGDYDQADEFLTKAMQSKGAENAAQASASCRLAQSGGEAVKAYRARFAQIPDPSPIAAGLAPAPAQPTAPAPAQAPASASPQSVVQAQSAGSGPPAPPKASVEERLKKLDDLLKKGLITRKDYDTKKAEILSEL